MSRSQLKYWPVLYGLCEEFIAEMKMVLVYGNSAAKALMVLKDDSIYEVDVAVNGSLKSAKVHELSDKGVKDFAWGIRYGVAALTDKGQVYYWKKVFKAQCAKEEGRPTLLGKSFCGKPIVQISCCDSCLFALTEDGVELEDLCVEFALNHMSVIVQSPQFATLSGERVRTFMIKAAAKGVFH